jgi:hypothetical protein
VGLGSVRDTASPYVSSTDIANSTTRTEKLLDWIHGIESMEIKESFSPHVLQYPASPPSFEHSFSFETTCMKDAYWFSPEIHWTFLWACTEFMCTLFEIKICVSENGHVGSLFDDHTNKNLLITLNVQKQYFCHALQPTSWKSQNADLD